MGANPSRHDRWDPYTHTYLVLVRRHRNMKPWQGIVLRWRSPRGQWQAQVLYIDDEAPGGRAVPVIEWVAVEHLTPVEADPNSVSRRSRR